MEPSDQAYTNEEQLIEDKFQELLNGYLNSNHRKKVEIIERAFKFAKEAHKGIRRRSGEPYILHPIAVARIVSQEIGLGSTSICAALLHDVVEDTEYTVEDIENHFGKKIASIVDGLTKISGGIFGDQASAQAENFRRLLLTMSEDIRVILIKMADRLHNMRTLGSMLPSKQYKIAGETLYIYAPLAHRLGLFAIKTELEDLAFKYEHPEAYNQIKQKIAETEESRQQIYNNFAKPIVAKLKELGFDFEMKARVKSIYSIWNKMEAKHIPFEEVYDLYAVRIIFKCPNEADEKKECWTIYSVITDIYKLHPERTRDWVSRPKANGYKALHLTVMGPDGNWIEVQIRSEKMDEIAERGFAAHWKYKVGNSDEESELDIWLKTIKDILEHPEPNAIDFLDTIKLNLFSTEIFVFTPKGDLITLPKDATALDLAFTLHSDLGFHCIAAKVNHRLVPLSQKLHSGDQVEILTSKSQTPKEEWLNLVTTAKARSRLLAALRKDRRKIIAKGEAQLKEFLESNHIELNNELMTKILSNLGLQHRDDLLFKIGNEEITLNENIKKIIKGKSLNPFVRQQQQERATQGSGPATAHHRPQANLYPARRERCEKLQGGRLLLSHTRRRRAGLCRGRRNRRSTQARMSRSHAVEVELRAPSGIYPVGGQRVALLPRQNRDSGHRPHGYPQRDYPRHLQRADDRHARPLDTGQRRRVQRHGQHHGARHPRSRVAVQQIT